MDSTRASLILRLQNVNDVTAWDEFTSIYSPVIFRVALRRGYQQADAENLVQEVFMSVAKSVTQWLEREDRGSFRAWLLTIARNEAVDMLTRRASRPLGQDGVQGEKILAQVAVDNDCSRDLELEYNRSIFQWAAAQVRDTIEEKTWRAFWLTSIDGLSVEKASDELGMVRGQIYCARSRVMAKIKKLVQEYETQA